ncbi:hypothetical protein CERZMDRAFT_84258 [Cercospora zeae-maydis SCOH1-5]|uniref:Uncharacterized protein n=1 Tax=Cercospora zeae-maydis SCOH1-5 TaxID=717836 RepID=A0A6A6FGK6_9PEZI|nr:hypothetical protein CERZMDRAFT_84258 [Cercospora zeae-maydis SCOH1-5]
MSFSTHFEKKVNEDMREEGQPGRAPTEMEDADMALKKNGYPSSLSDGQEPHDKKDYPPRFSTLFGATPPAPPPPTPPREYVREYYPEAKKRSGIHMPLALFIVLMITLFFESTIIFAYTIIGLYNNAPARLFPWAGQGSAVTAACDSSQPPAINIAPNFVIPGQGGAEHITELVTITITATPSTTSTSTTSSTSTSTSTVNESSQAAAMASDIAGILRSLGLGSPTTSSSISIALVTVKPTPSTVTSVTLITEDPSGNVLTRPTVTLTTFVDAPTAATSSSTSQEEIIIRPTTVSSSAA